jgi:hypothetical protein
MSAGIGKIRMHLKGWPSLGGIPTQYSGISSGMQFQGILQVFYRPEAPEGI